MDRQYDDFVRYLDAKKTVDDRALNKDVWQVFKREFVSLNSATGVPRVIEIGAGIGTMFERCVEWGLFESCDYTAVDSMSQNIFEASRRIVDWAPRSGYSVCNPEHGRFVLKKEDREINLHLEAADFFEFITRKRNFSGWDAAIANAFLDLLDVPTSLPKLFSVLKPNGLYYFTINFDGGTIFEPQVDPLVDCLIESLYHQTMDDRMTNGKSSGDSKIGRHLFSYLRGIGAKPLAAGSSDWVVFPGEYGYSAKEDYFLHFIIDTVGNAMRGNPELESAMLEEWLRVRHGQVDNNVLTYIAHQLDFVGRGPHQGTL